MSSYRRMPAHHTALRCAFLLSVHHGCGLEPLHLAAGCGHARVTGHLLTWRAHVNGVDDVNAWTPLHHAASKGHRVISELLVDHGAKVNARDRNGRSPLHLAAAQGHLDTVRYLSRLALINAVDETNKTPLGLAMSAGHDEVVAFLKSLGAK